MPGDPLAEARATWPGVVLSDDDLAAHLATKVQANPDVQNGLRMPELFLACACARRDPAAIAHFEAAYFAEVDLTYRRFDALPATLDDVRQRVRALLFFSDPPAVAGYSGTGQLRSWLRATVLHLLVNISTREARERPTEAAFFDAVVDSSPDVEAAYLKEACRVEFEQAFCAALESLEPRDRALAALRLRRRIDGRPDRRRVPGASSDRRTLGRRGARSARRADPRRADEAAAGRRDGSREHRARGAQSDGGLAAAAAGMTRSSPV